MLYRDESEVIAHLFSASHAESRVCFAQCYHVLYVIEYVAISSLVVPIDSIDAVRRSIAIMHSLSVTHYLIATPDERHSLRGQCDGLCEFHQCHLLLGNLVISELLFAFLCRKSALQSVGNAHIIMT